MSIKDRIINSPELQEARTKCNLDDLASGLNAQGITAVQSRFVTMRTITAECEDADVLIGALMKAATVSPSVAEMLLFLRSDSGMDVGHPNTQTKIDALATNGLFTQAQADEFKNLALLPVLVTRDQVEADMFNKNGTEKA